MAKVRSVTIDDQMEEFIDEQVSHGNYGSANELIGAGLRLLRRQAEVDAIRAAIAEGEESGEPQSFDGEEFLKEMHRKYVRQPPTRLLNYANGGARP